MMRGAFKFAIVSAAGAALFCAGFAIAKQPPPVKIDLGPLVPTPAPTAKAAQRIRMITSFTLQNKPDGDSLISFEATDFAQKEGESRDFRILATELYSLVTPKKEAAELRERVLAKIRDLEIDLLAYVEKVGPPRERQPLNSPDQAPAWR